MRIVTKDETINESLGESYIWISRFSNPDRFREIYQKEFKDNHVADMDDASTEQSTKIIGFVLRNGVLRAISSYEDAYVMLDSGRTLERLNRAS